MKADEKRGYSLLVWHIMYEAFEEEYYIKT